MLAVSRSPVGLMRVLAPLVLATSLPLAAVAQNSPAAKRPLVIEDYYGIRTVGSPRLSPNGLWVLYTVSTRVEETNGNRVETWLVPASGAAAPRRLMHDAADIAGASWQAHRVRYRAADAWWTIDPARSESPPQRDTASERPDEWSPDAEWLAQLVRQTVRPLPVSFASEFERRHEDRFRGAQFDWLNYKRDGAAAPLRDARDPAVSPPTEIVVTSADGTRTQRLTSLALQPTALAWTRDSRALLFLADSSYRDELTYGRTDLWLVTLDGEARRLTNDGYVYSNAVLSPDRKLLAYVRSYGTDLIIRDRLDHGGPRDLFVVTAPDARSHAGTLGQSRAINLTADWDLEPGTPVWSNDGKTIYFVAGIGGATHLFRVPAAGGTVQQVTAGPRRLGGVSFDDARRTIAYNVGVHDQPGDIFAARIDGSNERRLTNEHAAFLDQVALSRAEHVQFRSRDGTPIEGWLTLPYAYRADGGPYPLIVSNHGGPHSADGYGFDFRNQYFAANGYFVLEVNFRSSTGYGDAFKWGTWGEWGTKDGEDVMSGLDHVIARYPVAAKHIGVTGHSYGGFMTNWLITQYPDRFAAAVSGAGISNWISDYGLADIARTKETEFYGKPWEPRAREIMIRQSPLFYADRVRTPTLFVHGEVDYRVPFEEAEQFYFALKKNGVPTKIIMYEGQSHAISGHWNNVHRMLHELAWWNQYLKVKS